MKTVALVVPAPDNTFPLLSLIPAVDAYFAGCSFARPTADLEGSSGGATFAHFLGAYVYMAKAKDSTSMRVPK